jgi:hypothetical protein
MKLIKTFEQLINERKIRDVLYHFTGILQLLDILKSNKMCGSLVLGSDIEMKFNKNKPYYISFTRSIYGNTGYAAKYNGGARIVLNRQSIRNHGKLVPVDYYMGKRFSKNDDEMEDRLIMDKGCIQDIIKHIEEIHIYDSDLVHNILTDELKVISTICDKHGIPLHVFDNKKSYDIGKVASARSMDLSGAVINSFNRKIDSFDIEYLLNIFVIISYGDPVIKNKFVNTMNGDADFKYFLLQNGHDDNWLKTELDRLIAKFEMYGADSIGRGYISAFKDAIDNTKRNIHNIRRSKHPTIIKGMDMFTSYMKRHRLGTILDLYKMKFKEAWEDYIEEQVDAYGL